MKTLRAAAVAIAVLGAALVPAAPAIRDAWPSTRTIFTRRSVVARMVVLPWAVAGTLDATRDIRAGRLRIAYYVPRDEQPLFASLLWTRYGIRLAGQRRDARWAGYQHAMHREIERRFGTGVVETVAEDARRQHAEAAPSRLH